jgi:epoxyqueuosine reductase
MFKESFLNELGVVKYAYTEESKAISFKNFQSWLNLKLHGPLHYLEGDRAQKRQDLKLFWPEFESALVFLFSYKQTKIILDHDKSQKLKIASYALGFEGFDYHHILKEKLHLIAQELLKDCPELKYQISLDVHPVLERDLALRSGLGWIGKNSMLINKEEGSYFIIASLLLNSRFKIPVKNIETDHCGHCTSCIDACPTNAIDGKNRTIVASDCISTFTIEEMKLNAIPSKKMDLSSGSIFGCDICQDVCPWNKKLLKNIFSEKIVFSYTEMQKTILNYFSFREPKLIQNDLEILSVRQFIKKFKFTSLERSGKNGLLKNILFYLKKQ